ncbi:MAG: hypothetical protein V4439_03195 [Patescibacteria group bacterium]
MENQKRVPRQDAIKKTVDASIGKKFIQYEFPEKPFYNWIIDKLEIININTLKELSDHAKYVFEFIMEDNDILTENRKIMVRKLKELLAKYNLPEGEENFW